MMKEYLRKEIKFTGLPSDVMSFENGRKIKLDIVFRPKAVTNV